MKFLIDHSKSEKKKIRDIDLDYLKDKDFYSTFKVAQNMPNHTKRHQFNSTNLRNSSPTDSQISNKDKRTSRGDTYWNMPTTINSTGPHTTCLESKEISIRPNTRD